MSNQILSQNFQHMQPQPHQMPAPTPRPSPTEILAAITAEVRSIKSDLTSAVNPYTLNKCLARLMDVVEFLVAGEVTQGSTGQTPGMPVQPENQAARVQIFNAMPTPGSPVQGGGDVQFFGSRPQGNVVNSGQTVEYYGGPGQNANPGAARVEYVAAPQSYESNGQKVEFYGAPAPAAPTPSAQTPVSNAPAAQFVPGLQMASVEAGQPLPAAPAAAPPAAFAAPAPAPTGAPVSEVLAQMPIPLAMMK